jgi:hypothetical protein
MSESQHLDSASINRLALGECSRRERHRILAHCAECRYCTERCQTVCGHLVAAWHETVLSECRAASAAARRDLTKLIPAMRPQWAQGGAVAALAAISLMLVTGPEWRRHLADLAFGSPDRIASTTETVSAPVSRPPILTSAVVPEPEVLVDEAAIPTEATDPSATPQQPQQLRQDATAPAAGFPTPVRRRSAAATPTRQILVARFVPPVPARARLVSAHSIMELAPPPALRTQTKAPAQLVASLDLQDVPPPPRSKFGAFFHSAGKGMKSALGVLAK